MKKGLFSLFLVFFVIIPIEMQGISDVPAILWNIKGDALPIKPVSAFEVSSKKVVDDFLKETLNKKSTAMLVFLADQLSLEDFSAESPVLPGASSKDVEEFLDTHAHMLLPHVQDPLKRLHSVHCVQEELQLDGIMDENTLQAVSSALDRSCVVILHWKNSEVTDEMGKSQVETAKKLLLPSVSTSKKNVIGMFSGAKSSWKSLETQRKSRSLLAEDTKSEGQLFNNTCLIMYATNITVRVEEAVNGTTVVVPLDDYNFDGSDDCYSNVSSYDFQLNFPGVKKYENFGIRMVFERRRNMWMLNDTFVIVEDRNEAMQPRYVMEAPLGFSYSCGNLTFVTTNSTIKYTVKIDGFQIQPFDVKEVFSQSFDCIPYFTIPIWMGLMVGILFIIILNTGVYALFAVKTMDRFDDPKGKTISVAFSAD